MSSIFFHFLRGGCVSEAGLATFFALGNSTLELELLLLLLLLLSSSLDASPSSSSESDEDDELLALGTVASS